MKLLLKVCCLVFGHRETQGERTIGSRLWLWNYCERCEHILAMKVL